MWPSPAPVRSRESGMVAQIFSRAAVTATGRRGSFHSESLEPKLCLVI